MTNTREEIDVAIFAESFHSRLAYVWPDKEMVRHEIEITLESVIKLLESNHHQELQKAREDTNEALYALGLMYLQYVSKDGHLFMSAGETAQTILEEHGLLVADDIGRGEPDWNKLEALNHSDLPPSTNEDTLLDNLK